MADEEDDPDEKIGPTIRYLQKLGADHLEVIFESSRWVFDADRKAALEVRSDSGDSHLHSLMLTATDLHRRSRRSGIAASPRDNGSPRANRT